MKNYLITLLTLFSLVYNQVLFAAGGSTPIKPLNEVIDSFNKMRLNPASFSEGMDADTKKIYQSLLKKSAASELPEMIKVSEGTYQFTVGEDKVIFDEKNWTKKRFIINSLLVDFSRVTDVNQLMDTISTALSSKNRTTGLFDSIKNILIQDSYAWEWNMTTGLIAAGLIAALGVGGYLIYKNNNNDKKNEVKVTATPAPTGTTTSEGEGKSCKESVGFVWKLNKDGNTSIMINKKFADCTIRVNGKSPNVSGGIFKSDGRRYFRFRGHPKQFGPTATVEIVCNSKVEETINIPDTGKRCAYFPGGWGI